MGISRTTVQWLRSGGHDAAHVAELGMKSAPDADVLALASREQRVVLTFDLDFPRGRQAPIGMAARRAPLAPRAARA
jgi:predicted nuclease of predicted toxin-antitoxin system